MNRILKVNLIFLLIISLIIFIGIQGLAIEKNDYPSKPIKVVVPYNPGGGSDLSARTFAKYSEEYFGEPMIVTNIAGAGGSTGGQEVLNSRPDGYTIFWHHNAMHVSYHTGIADFTWDSFTPICRLASAPGILAVSKDAPWDTIDDLVEYMKKNPKEIRMGVGIGATSHFLGVELDIATGGGDKISFVAVSGDAGMLQAILGGQIELAYLSLASAKEYVKSGKIKELATTGASRNKYFPDTPTLVEKGLNATAVMGYGVFGPPELSEEIVNFISKTFEKMTKDERLVKDLESLNLTNEYLNTEEFVNELLENDLKYYKSARVAGLIKKK